MPATFMSSSPRSSRVSRSHYRDMQDIEFTIQEGHLWMLQTRSGKRTAKAALKIAVDMADEGLISRDEAVGRIDPASLDQLLHPTLDPAAKREVIGQGLPASPGAASGAIVLRSGRGREVEGAGQARHPGAHRDEPRGHSRHARGRGHPHHPRRHDLPRRRRRPRHGQALRLRRRQHPCRLRQWPPSTVPASR